MRTKRVLLHPKAKKDFKKLDQEVKQGFGYVFDALTEARDVPSKKLKKLRGTHLFEIRVRSSQGQYRGIGGQVKSNFVVVLFFKKKSQRIPKRELRTAIQRFRDFLN